MYPLQYLVPLEPLDAAAPFVPAVVLVLAVANAGTRFLAHRRHVAQAAAGGAEALERSPLHGASSVLLVLASFGYLIVAPHAGAVTSVLVLGTVLADFFEFEARLVEARNGMRIERPKSALTGSLLVLLYAGYQGLFFVVQPYWDAIV
jgi:hypothetical protein